MSGLQKNVASQKWVVFAFNETDNTPVTGDAAQITGKVAIDWGTRDAIGDTNPTEQEDGYYVFDLTQGETNGNVLNIYPESSTGDVRVIGVPGTIYTVAAGIQDFSVDKLEDMLDGTGAVLTLTQLRINSSAAGGAIDIDNDSGPGIQVDSDGIGIMVESVNGDGVKVIGGDGAGLWVRGDNGDGLFAESNAGNGITAAGTVEDILADITGSLSGSVGSVTAIVSADLLQINSATTPVDNLELQYDGTGLSGDTFPATQAQIGTISSGSAAINTVAESTEDTTPSPVGTPTNSYTATIPLDGTYHSWVPATGELEFAYNFNIGANASPVGVIWHGFCQSINDSVAVYARDWVGPSWQQVGTINGTVGATDQEVRLDLTTAHVNTGANAGDVRIRFVSTGGTIITTFATDQILCSFTSTSQSSGYEGGAIWVDTNASNENTVEDVDGIAKNPVSTWAAALTLSASTGLNRFQLANGSAITLTANSDNYTLGGNGWVLSLGGQSIEGMAVSGALVTGTGLITTSPAVFNRCAAGAVTIGPSTWTECGIGAAGGTFTGGGSAAGDYVFADCISLVAGSGTPDFNFGGRGAATGINNRRWDGSGSYTVDSDCTISVGVLVGGGQTFISSGADIELRGRCREVTFTLSAGGTTPAIQAIVFTGDITISGTSAVGTTIQLDGVGLEPTDTSVNTTVTSRLQSPETISDAVADEVLTGATHNVTNSLGRRIRELDEQVGYEGGSIWLDSINGVSGTTVGENGTVNNPVAGIADAVSLAVATGRRRIRVASGSTVTLVADLEGYEIHNSAWNLALEGFSISNTCIRGATVTGIATGASRPQLTDCQLGAVTLPPSLIKNCGVGDSSGTFTFGGAGEYVMDDCYSVVPGSGTPVFVATGIGSATGINNRHWHGGASYTVDSDITISHEVSQGGGTTFNTSGADIEVRGITRSLTLAFSAGGTTPTIQFVGITGPVTISGTAAAGTTVNLYGVGLVPTGSATNATVTSELTSPDRINAECDTALSDYDGPTNAEMVARTILAAAYFDPAADPVANVTLVATTTTNTDMRGTDSVPTAVENRQEMDSNSTQLAAIVADTNELQQDDVPTLIGDLNDFDPSTDAVDNVTTVDSVTGSVGSVTDVNAIADAILTRDVSNVEATEVVHSLYTIILATLESSISDTTWTIKQTDGSTTHQTKTVTLDAGADPITGVT